MSEKYPIDNSFGIFSRFTPPLGRGALALARAALTLCPKGLHGSVTAVKLNCCGVRTRLISPREGAEKLPCLVYFHGGGFVFKAAGYHYRNVKTYAAQAGCRVLLVDYRLAPKNPYPAPVEDCFAAYSFLLTHAEAYGVDRNNIAVGGDSAGACLAAEVVRLAREQQLAMPRLCMLIYPVLDARMQTPSMKRFSDTPMWNARLNAKMWRYYLNGQPYSSPSEWEDVSYFPPVYMETAEFDCLHDEGIQFAEKLRAQGVRVAVNETHGTMHGYDIASRSPITQEHLVRRTAALRAAFAEGRKQG